MSTKAVRHTKINKEHNIPLYTANNSRKCHR
nr:MAG TPA: hypothetical protein [Caudoviricetes sp.]